MGSERVVVRLSPEPDAPVFGLNRHNRASDYNAIEIARALSETLAPKGPKTAHAIYGLTDKVFEGAPNFARPLAAIRQSTLASFRRGAPHFQFKPLLIEAPPGCGKTTVARRLTAANGLPARILDATTVTTGTPIVSADSVWSNAPPSEVVQFLAHEQVQIASS